VAVPSGKYELSASVDLSPLFGVIASTQTVDVKVPGPEVLDEHLKDLESEDANVRVQAIYKLRYFKPDAERVVAALASALEDPEEGVRAAAMSVFNSYPEHAKKHLDVFVKLLSTGGNRQRYTACSLLARVAPWDEKILAAMKAAKEAGPTNYETAFQSTIDRYVRKYTRK